MKESVIQTKSYDFALRIVNAYIFLSKEKQEYVLSKQLLRSGTVIGALVSESKFAQSKPILSIKCTLRSKKPTKQGIGLTFCTTVNLLPTKCLTPSFLKLKKLSASSPR